ncbi:dUTP diphosphatase [Williamwhitmania taraxaci]|uniref:Deoxyuridine 5'-triphosphate nucleotidohydrolase n=1 Tax=Williamwhitmania taraxaci TaxID=1640674 RepID=A0A1G6GYI8_9BACT|nr:dUTP diphosphatase [Williamwhitmania taraxaci]SDB86745.1 dUTP pyrophosphatase [Williamwhitmania taraxaci]
MEVKVINSSRFDLPSYATVGSSGLDLKANIEETLIIGSLERCIVPTGLFLEIPLGYEAQVRPRSGLAFKHGITVLNTPGTIDADYRGEIKVILVNLSNQSFSIEAGERIAQIVFSKIELVSWVDVNAISNTDRGDGGFGHTGR